MKTKLELDIKFHDRLKKEEEYNKIRREISINNHQQQKIKNFIEVGNYYKH